MSRHHFATVRVGILVERMESKIIPFEYSMFYCRSRDQGDERHVPLSNWAADEVNLLSVRSGLPGQNKIPVGGSARYWVHMRMSAYCDYWGEWDSDVEVIKCRKIK